MRALASLACLALLAAPALADPPFQGPEVHDGAWRVTRAWSDPVGGDPTKGSYAWAYRHWAKQRAEAHVAAATRLDCADLSIDLVCEYAALNGLPVKWRVWYAPDRKFVTISATDRQFGSAAQFSTWSKWFLGAMNLADNTDAIGYEEWAGGDMVLMNWNQSPVEPNFPGRQVWHTYLVGVPDALIFYGNIDGGAPLPVTSTDGASTLDRVRTSPDRHGLSPRRFAFLRGAVRAPEAAPTSVAVVGAPTLNLRGAASTTAPILARARAGDRLPVLGRQGLWVKVRLPDGRTAYAHSAYLRVEPAVDGLTASLPGH